MLQEVLIISGLLHDFSLYLHNIGCGSAISEKGFFCDCSYLSLYLRLLKEIYNLKISSIMTKAEIVAEVAKQTGVEKTVVMNVVEAFMESVKDSMIAGNEVFLRGFGSFIIKKRAEKVARNISKNTTITIPAHNIPAFKPAKTFLAAVRETK